MTEKIIGSYYGEVEAVKISKDGTECKIVVSCDIASVPENTASWIREIIQNPAAVTIQAYDGLKDIGKRGPGRPKKEKPE